MMLRLALLLMFLFVPSLALATDRYVINGAGSTGCSNGSSNYNPETNTCGSGSSLVYTSIAGMITAHVGGDHIFLRAGTYTAGSATGPFYDNVKTGTTTTPTIIEGYLSETVTIRPTTCARIVHLNNDQNIQYKKMIFDAINCTSDAIKSDEARNVANILFEDIEAMNSQGGKGFLGEGSNITFRRANIHHNLGTHGVYVFGGTFLIEDSEIHDNANYGLHFFNQNGISTSARFTVRRNKIYSNCTQFSSCFEAIVGGTGHVVERNVFYDPNRGGLQIHGSSPNNITVRHNTLVGAGTHTGINVQTGNSTVALQNNIVVNWSTNILNTAGATLTDNRTTGTLTDLFTSPSTDDYTLKAGSAAINDGTALSGQPFNGSAPDHGAFETFGFSSASIDTFLMDVTLGMNLNVPVLPSTGQTGWTVACSGSDCGTPVVASAVRITGADSVVRLTITGIGDDGNCDAGQTWTVSYSGSGNVTDSALIGNELVQPMSAFTTQGVTEVCSGSSGTPPSGDQLLWELDEGTGTTVEDTSGNNLDGTFTGNSTTWTDGKNANSSALLFVAGTEDDVSVSYGNGIAVGSTSLTIMMGIKPTAGNLTDNKIFFSAPNGTNQRLYLSWSDQGTYTMGIQDTSGVFGVESEFPVVDEWTHICLVMNAATNTATLHVNGVEGTSAAAVEEYTDYSLAGNFSLGALSGASSIYMPGVTIDFLKIFQSVESCSDDNTAWNAASPTPTGTYSQVTHQWQLLRTPATSHGALAATVPVMVGGAVALVTQIDCTVADCDPTGPRLYYSKNSGTYLAVPDACTSDSVCFYGAPDADILSGTVTCCLSGALTANDGPTNTTAAALPVFDLAQNGSFVRRSILKFGSSVTAGDSFCFKEYHQTDLTLNGGYTPTAGACVTIVGVSAGVGF